MSWDEEAFKEKLEGTHEFPGSYTFKFIVKAGEEDLVKELVRDGEVSLKPSSGGKYVSVTIRAKMQSSQEVVDVYKESKKIDGLMAL